MFGLAIPELIIIGVIIFLLFGGRIMGQFFSGLAVAIKESKKAIKEINKPIEEIKNE